MCAVDLIPEQGGNAQYPTASCSLNFPEVVTALASSSFLHGENCFGFKACLVYSPGHCSNLIPKKGMKWAEGLAGWLRELATQSWRPDFGSQYLGDKWCIPSTPAACPWEGGVRRIAGACWLSAPLRKWEHQVQGEALLKTNRRSVLEEGIQHPLLPSTPLHRYVHPRTPVHIHSHRHLEMHI